MSQIQDTILGDCWAIFWKSFGTRQNYIVTFSMCGSEPSDPTDGIVPPEPLDSFVTSMFGVNFLVNCMRKIRGILQDNSLADFLVDTWNQTKLLCYIQCARLRAFRSCGWQRATGAIGFLRNFYAVGPKQCPTRRSGKNREMAHCTAMTRCTLQIFFHQDLRG